VVVTDRGFVVAQAPEQTLAPIIESSEPQHSTWSRRRFFRLARTVLLIGLVLLSWSVIHGLRAPGNDPASAKLAEWARNHGLGVVVTVSESIQYRLHPPRVGGAPNTSVISSLPKPTSAPLGDAPVPEVLPSALTPLANGVVPGEGIFHTVALSHGQPAVQIAYLRPDDQHTSYLAGVAWMSGSRVRLVQHPGAVDPGRLSLWSQPASVPPSARAGLVATFNSGFKIHDAQGGYFADGHTVGTLTPGAASIVIYKDGSMDVGAWGTDVRMTSSVVSVRQSLRLLVSHGQVVPHLDRNVESNWGATIGGGAYVWRSGLGVTANGDLVYVVGDALSAHSLAVLLHHAGAVRAMQLDINPAWVSYMWYSKGATPTSPVPHKILPFARIAGRYLSPVSRDFFAVYAR
jgi:hypothetical protein